LLTGKYQRALPPRKIPVCQGPPALKDRYVTPRNRHRRKAAAFAQAARPLDAGARFLLAGIPPASLQRDRRRDRVEQSKN